jgi:hypothetical protein
MSGLVTTAREAPHAGLSVDWPRDLRRGVGGGDNRRLGGSEGFMKHSPVMTLLGRLVSLEEWQSEAPLTWYHGSPMHGLTGLDPNHPKTHTSFIAVWVCIFLAMSRLLGTH